MSCPRKHFVAVALWLAASVGFAYDITTDTLWSGDHRVTESVVIQYGATLRIDAGTTVQLPADAYIHITRTSMAKGRILAEGTSARPIIFTRTGHKSGSGYWGKVSLVESARENRFTYCQFWYGNGNATVPDCSGKGVITSNASRFLAQDCGFYWHLGDSAYIENGSTATLRRCYFHAWNSGPPWEFGTCSEEGVTGCYSHVEEDSCIFAYREGRYDASDIEGTGFHVWVHDSIFLGSNLDDGCDFDNSDGMVERCVFYNYNGSVPGWATRCGGVTMNDAGTRIVRNNIFISCRQGIISKGDTYPNITNCTFFNCFNDIAAYEYGEPSPKQVGHPTVRNCLMWATTSQTLVLGNDSGTGEPCSVDIDYCLVDSTPTLHRSDPRVKCGSHIFKADPLFANPATTMTANPDFHLRSKAGRWDPKANGGAGAWVVDAVHSPAIDAGDPASSYSLEPSPNGNRVNLGAYGNTAQASKSIPLYSLQIRVTPTTAGTVTKTPARTTYFYRETVGLRAVPAPDYRFVRWEGSVTGTKDTLSVVMDANKSVTAVFAYSRTAVSRWAKY